jgi:hypothetical protein
MVAQAGANWFSVIGGLVWLGLAFGTFVLRQSYTQLLLRIQPPNVHYVLRD